ncbi:MAG TPA: class III extradiol dioxygenase subunit B-like domain-containing protein [Dehalococcoidia bacterium]|nr:class III extradiol dioxygenase subunit B-like domain-containing protein [Dehalococcoidia bacterium]
MTQKQTTQAHSNGIVFGAIAPHPPLLVPEVGRGQETAIKSTSDAMARLSDELALAAPDCVAIISPHGKGHSEAMGVFTGKSSTGDMSAWGVPTQPRTFDNDLALAKAIMEECAAAKIPAQTIGDQGYNLDHGVMVPKHFLDRKTVGLPLVLLTFSWLPLHAHFAFGKAIRVASARMNRRLALVASGDLSHRLIPGAPAGYEPLGTEFDRKLVDAVSRLDAQAVLDLDPNLIERAGECGLRSITILLGALQGLAVKPQVLSYEGPFGVGYMVASFSIKEQLHKGAIS